MGDEDRAGPFGHQPLGRIETWRQRADVQVDRHCHESMRFEDSDHVRMRDRGDKDLVAGVQVESIEEQVEPRADRAASDAMARRRPSACQPGAEPLGYRAQTQADRA